MKAIVGVMALIMAMIFLAFSTMVPPDSNIGQATAIGGVSLVMFAIVSHVTHALKVRARERDKLKTFVPDYALNGRRSKGHKQLAPRGFVPARGVAIRKQ